MSDDESKEPNGEENHDSIEANARLAEELLAEKARHDAKAELEVGGIKTGETKEQAVQALIVERFGQNAESSPEEVAKVLDEERAGLTPAERAGIKRLKP